MGQDEIRVALSSACDLWSVSDAFVLIAPHVDVYTENSDITLLGSCLLFLLMERLVDVNRKEGLRHLYEMHSPVGVRVSR